MKEFFERIAQRLGIPVWFVYVFAALLLVALLHWTGIAGRW